MLDQMGHHGSPANFNLFKTIFLIIFFSRISSRSAVLSE